MTRKKGIESSRQERTDPTLKRTGGPKQHFTEEELESAVLITDDDIESIEMMEVSGTVEQPTRVGIPGAEEDEPSVIVVHEPGTATWDDVSFFHREAVAISSQQPERSGLMWLEAAIVSQLARSPKNIVLQYLDSALEQAPDNPPLISLVRREMVRLRPRDKALRLTDRLVKTGGAADEHLGALLEAATIERHVKNNGEGALALLRRALALNPASVTALVLAAIYHQELGQQEGAAGALEQLADVLATPEDRSACLHSAGTLRELALEQLERAEQDYTRALEVDPENLPAWIAQMHLHRQAGAWQRLCYDLERTAALQVGDDLRQGLLMRAGTLHIHRTEDLEAASRVLSQAAAIFPNRTAPLSRLIQVHESLGHVEQLVTILRGLLSLTIDPSGQAVLLVRIGRLLELQRGHTEEAIAAYQQALTVKPGYFPALRALGAIFRRRGDFNNLLEILLPETEGSDEPDRRAMRCVEVGAILADRLRRPDEAIDFYRRALELDPELKLAAWRLGRLMLQQGRFHELAKLRAWQAGATADDQSRFHHLMDLANLERGPLQSPREAIETLKRAWSIGHNRIATMELLDLYHQVGDYSALVDLLLWEADQTSDVGEAIWRRIQAAMVLEDHLEEHDRSLELFWNVLGAAPTCVGAIRAAGQICFTHERWQELIRLHLHELDHNPELAGSGEPWCEIARIYEEHLGEHDEAIENYKKALALDSGSIVALDALERLIRFHQRHKELVPVLQRYASRRHDPHAASDILCRAAELAEMRLDDPARAAKLYAEALELFPDNSVALHGLASIQQRQGQYEHACGSLRRLVGGMGDARSQHLLMLLVARLGEFRLEHIDPAPYDMAAQLPELAARVRLDQLRTRLGSSDEEVVAILLAAGSATTDNALGVALLVESCLRSEWIRALDPQREAASRALGRDQDDLGASWCLQRALRATGEWRTLASLLEAEAGRCSDPTIQVALLSQAAQAYLAAEILPEAARLARQCLSIDSQHLPSIRRLIFLAMEWQNHTELASLCDQLAATCADYDNRLQAYLTAADCWSEKVGDPVNAMNSLKRILAEDPNQHDAFARAWQLLSSLGDFGQLSQLYTRRIAACPALDEKAQLLRQHVNLLRDQLSDAPGAIAELNKLLELVPEDVEALAALAELSQVAQRWSDAADALARLTRCCTDSTRRLQASLAWARIALRRLQKPRDAHAVLEHVLQEDSENLEAKRLMVEVLVEEGRWEEARRRLDEVTAQGGTDLRVWALTQHAEVARVGLRDEGLQERYEREALAMASERPDLLDQLVVHYREHRRQRHLLEIATRVDLTANAAARVRLVLARLLLEDLNEPGRAVDYLRECLSMDPKNVSANLLMGSALEHRGEIEGAVASYRKVLLDDPRRAEAYRGLNRLMGVLGKPVLATAAAAVLDVLDESTPAERGQVKTLDQLDIPRGSLRPSALPLGVGLSQVSELLELVAPHLGQVYPLELHRPQPDGVPTTVVARRIGAVLGLPSLLVSIEGESPAAAGVGALRVNERVAQRPRGPIFRFWAGRALAGAVTAGSLLERLSNHELGALVEALFAARPGSLAQQLRKQINRSVPRKVRKLLDQMRIDSLDPRIWDHYRNEEQRRADFIGMLICGNPKVAIAEVAAVEGVSDDPTRSSRIRHMMIFAVSDRYAVLQPAVWRPPSGELV